MIYVVYLLVFGFLTLMLFSGGMFSAAGAFGLVYLLRAAYQDFKYKPEDEAETVPNPGEPEAEHEAEPDADFEGGFNDKELVDELAIASKTSSPRGNARTFDVDLDVPPDQNEPINH